MLLGFTQLRIVYLFALGFGLADAFFYPVQTATVPQLVERGQLQLANPLAQSALQLSMFAGPVLAIVLSAASRTTEPGASTRGLGLALIVDAATFLVSAMLLWAIQLDEAAQTLSTDRNMLTAMRDGIRLVWREPVLRVIFILSAATNFLIGGPTNVGIPILADTRLPEGAAAFGAGSILGLSLAAGLPRPKDEYPGLVLTVVWSFVGSNLALIGTMNPTLSCPLPPC